MRKFLLITLFISLFIVACTDNPDIMLEREHRLLELFLDQNNITTGPLPSGIYFLEKTTGTGLTPVSGDFVIVEFTASLIDGTVFDTTSEELALKKGIFSADILYGSTKFRLLNTRARGLELGLELMSEGGEARIIIPSTLGFGPNQLDIVPPYSTLIYDIKLIKVIKDPIANEASEIQNYINLYRDSTHLTIQSQSHAIGTFNHEWHYIELLGGTGDSIVDTKIVSILYSGKLLDGRVFDSNFGRSPFNVTVGERRVVLGMELGLKKMKNGGRARIIIPSVLAYGEAGSGRKIPPFSPLVFDVVVKSVSP